MPHFLSLRCFAVAVLATLAGSPLSAQYPNVGKAIGNEARTKREAADRDSDAAWARALPAVEAAAKLGKPYLPGAEKPSDLPQAGIPAFPGAHGGGMYSFGGRGGRILVVTSLADRGPGTLREALETGGPRLIVFNVAGIIRLESRIRIRAPYVTLSGATAPGDGVCIAGDTVEIDTHDVVIRHLRFRRGAMWVGDRNDSLGGNPVGNVMIDHVSASWGLDENMSMYRHMYDHDNNPATPDLKLPTVNITIQHSIFSEGLNPFHHAFGSTIGGLNSTFHHNLWACNSGRNPSVGMYGDFTFVNNVVFNWVNRTVDGGDERSFFNIYHNWFKPGPATPTDAPIRHRILKPESKRSKTEFDVYGRAYVTGNVVEGNPAVTADNWAGGVQISSRGPAAPLLAKIRADTPYAHAPLPIQTAAEAYAAVLVHAGATLPRRDAVDARVIETVRTGKVTAQPQPDLPARLGGVGYQPRTIEEIAALVPKGIITDPAQVGGYPTYQGTPYPDADHDGLPDAWEKAHGLDPKNPADASADANGDGYTNIEDFLNGLDPRAPKTDWTRPANNVDRRLALPAR